MGSRLLSASIRIGLVALACGLVVSCVAVLRGGSDPDPRRVAPTGVDEALVAPITARATPEPREVLRAWDAQRSQAWVDGDLNGLADLYTPGSVAGRRDVELLGRWTARSLRVTRLEPQVLGLVIVRAAPYLLVLRVTDRIGVLSADLAGRPVSVPRDAVSTRRVVLRRAEGDPVGAWRVASVTGLATPASLGG